MLQVGRRASRHGCLHGVWLTVRTTIQGVILLTPARLHHALQHQSPAMLFPCSLGQAQLLNPFILKTPKNGWYN